MQPQARESWWDRAPTVREWWTILFLPIFSYLGVGIYLHETTDSADSAPLAEPLVLAITFGVWLVGFLVIWASEER